MKKYEFGGGKVRRESQCVYVDREADSKIYNYLKSDFTLIVITAPRQCGKTSMAYGIGEKLSKEGFKFIFVDFRLFSIPSVEYSHKDEAIRLFHSIFRSIAKQLESDDEGLEKWLGKSSVKKISLAEQFINFFKDYIRKTVKIEEPLVVVFDELDQLGEWGYYTDDFLYGLQMIFNEREKLKLSFITSGITHPGLLLKGYILSAFKIGVHLHLPDFDTKEETVKQWIQGLKIPNEKIRFEVGKEILTQTGGQPFLTAYLMHQFNETNGQEVSDVEPLVDEIVKNALNPQKGLPHFKAPRDFIVERERYAFAVLEEYKKILKEPIPISPIEEKVFGVLNTTGLTKVVGGNLLDVRSPIHRRVFDVEWIERTEIGFGKRDWYAPTYIPTYSTKVRPRICLFNTGGTIGMVEHGYKMVPPQDKKEFFSIYPSLENIAEIDFVQFNAKDAANMFPKDWTEIAKAIYARRNDGYDGFVVAHGTDTMTYTASAIAYALGPGLDKPVVFVGSQTPHYIAHGDALVNLSRACMIASTDIPEVVISFGDEVYRAVRAEKYSDYHFKGFHSPTFFPLAIITEMIEIQKANIWFYRHHKMECKTEFEERILQIRQYPGFNADWLNKLLESETIKGIIIESLGVGNLPNFPGSKYNLLPLIEKAIKEYKIPVIITSKYPVKTELATKYKPATEPLLKGAISAGNMTSPAALTKLMWLLPQIERDIEDRNLKGHLKFEELKRLISHSYVGEIDTPEEKI